MRLEGKVTRDDEKVNIFQAGGWEVIVFFMHCVGSYRYCLCVCCSLHIYEYFCVGMTKVLSKPSEFSAIELVL